MAGDRVNNYSQVDSNILELQLTTDKTFKGYHQLTLTEYDTTTVPAIAAGSAIECNGALYKFDSEEAISTTDPVTSATVADGTVYVCIVPGATTCTAAFTATAPTWSDSKQGWYGTGGSANYRYCEFVMTKSSAAYTNKISTCNAYGNKSLVKLQLSSNFNISAATETIIVFNSKDYDLSNEYNTSTGIFTAKSSGFYYFSGFIVATYNEGTGHIIVRKNGSTASGFPFAGYFSPSGAISHFSQVDFLNAGDTLSVSILSDDSSYYINQHSQASIMKVL